MKKFTVAAVAVVLAASTSGIAFADKDHGVKATVGDNAAVAGGMGGGMAGGQGMMGGQNDMMKMMMKMHRDMMKGGGMGGGQGMMGGGMGGGQGMMGGGMAGGQGMMGGMSGGNMDQMDRNMMGMMMGDNANAMSSPDEMRSMLMTKMGEFDADGNATLSMTEFEALHGSLLRETMVDRFQRLDADGDGNITATEMADPADRLENRQMLNQNGQAGQMTPGANNMMNDDANATESN